MPRVRRLAKELGVDLSLLKPADPDGLITEEDVRSFKEGNTLHTPSVSSDRTRSRGVVAQDGRVERVAFKGVRRIVAINMRKSLDSVAQTLHVDEADVTDLVALRETEKLKARQKGIKLTYLPFFVKAIVAALKKYPYVNASLDEEAAEIVLKYYYNIGIATNTDQGLVVPVLKDAEKKDVWKLASEIASLAEKARAGRLALDDVQDSTFSITNIGSMRGQISFPVISLPNAAIIGIQSITKRPVVRNGEIVVRDMVNLSLAFDHRIFDGATASAFTTEIIRRLETPALLFWDEG
jgi:pyruvate dehydrogenase E2 component (dihydrolipoamide acetyltransferase)